MCRWCSTHTRSLLKVCSFLGCDFGEFLISLCVEVAEQVALTWMLYTSMHGTMRQSLALHTVPTFDIDQKQLFSLVFALSCRGVLVKWEYKQL
jgi:hypothetical protein